MLACVDVDYRAAEAVAACLLFRDWPDATPADEWVVHLPPAAPYQPGQFYRRELPPLLAALGRVTAPLDGVVIDSYVWLDEHGRQGLGAHLHAALGGAVPVIGVAKTAFAGSTFAVPVLRGGSQAPLHITAAGMSAQAAADAVRGMHGPYRLPTLLKRVDRLCRDAPAAPPP